MMRKNGFTLIELLAVVLIMGILTAIALPQYRKSLERSRVAEALQMLPAIYDARERLITEQLFSWPSDSRIKPDWLKLITFPKLDVDFKGRVEVGNVTRMAGHGWSTPNMHYELFAGCKEHAVDLVSAEMSRGVYKGVVLIYNGEEVQCFRAEGPEDACAHLAVTEINC